MNISLLQYLIFSLFLFILGFIGLITSKNIIKVLIFIEIIMTSINLNFIAFTSYKNYIALDGLIFPLFITATSAVQSAIAIVLIYFIYKNKDKLTTEEIEELKG